MTALDVEIDSLDAARERLRPVAEEVAGFTAAPLGNGTSSRWTLTALA